MEEKDTLFYGFTIKSYFIIFSYFIQFNYDMCISSLNVVQNNWIIAVSPSNGSLQFILNGTVPSAGYDSSAQISWAVVG